MANKPTLALIPSAYKASKVYSVLPNNGDGDFTFSRASNSTRVNKDGLIETVSINVPKLDYYDGGCPSLLLEPQRTNLYLNSEELSTQNVTTSATSYTVSFYGTGTITFSGSYSGSLVGLGENQRVSLTFTATAGTLTSTVSGSVLNAQIENNIGATSYIPTAGSAVTRNFDQLINTTSYTLGTDATFYFDFEHYSYDANFTRTFIAKSSDSLKYINLFAYRSFEDYHIRVRVTSNNGTVNEIISFGETYIEFFKRNKAAFRLYENNFEIYVNGMQVKTGTSTIGDFDVVNGISLVNDFVSFPSRPACKLYDFRVYDETMTQTELETLTTL